MSVIGAMPIARGDLARYELLRKIASGGMAELHLARAHGIEGFKKLVVVKRILPHMADDEHFVRMFLDEARLAATLHHPNIAQVYDIGVSDDNYFFAMEFVHGENLRAVNRQVIAQKQLIPLEHALAIIHDVALALDYAHNKRSDAGQPLDIVHRDVSPANIMVSYDGSVKLVDFGIARAAQRSIETQTGSLKGKVRYMSPEQCAGRKVDLRSDLFSLGAVLYEITTGVRPFDGDSDFEILRTIIENDVTPPRMLVPDYPLGLQRIVLRLLERDLDRRYWSAESLIVDLEAFIRDARLTVSSIRLRHYMRTLFRDKIVSWHSAREEGISLAHHLTSTMTGESPATPVPADPLQAVDLEVVVAREPARRWRSLVAVGAGLAAGFGLSMTFIIGYGDDDSAGTANVPPSELAAPVEPEPEIETRPEPERAADDTGRAADDVVAPDSDAAGEPRANDVAGRERDDAAGNEREHAGEREPRPNDVAASEADSEPRADEREAVKAANATERSSRAKRPRPRRVRSTRRSKKAEQAAARQAERATDAADVKKAARAKKAEEAKWDRDSPVLPD